MSCSLGGRLETDDAGALANGDHRSARGSAQGLDSGTAVGSPLVPAAAALARRGGVRLGARRSTPHPPGSPPMTLVLAASAWLSAFLVVVTIALLAVPTTPAELALWRRLRTARVRRWLTRRRHLSEPLDAETTPQVARKNLRWHLALTTLFSAQLAIAAASERAWWRPLALLLVLPSIAYFAGSLVQRQKVAILRSRRDPRRSDPSELGDSLVRRRSTRPSSR